MYEKDQDSFFLYKDIQQFQNHLFKDYTLFSKLPWHLFQKSVDSHMSQPIS